jgi:acyl-CoA thioester hydrolase
MSGGAFSGFAIVVRPEWTATDHLTVASFSLLFDLATDALREHCGVGRGYAQAQASSIVVVEAHHTYLREVREGDRLRFRTRLLGAALKRLHVFHAMHREGEAEPLATAELMLVHIDRTTGRAVPFSPKAMARLSAEHEAHAKAAWPPQAGRAIARVANGARAGLTGS